MKLLSLAAAILTATTFAARAEVSPIHLTVEQVTKTDAKAGARGQPSFDKTQTRSLKIRVDNNSKEAFDGLVIKYWFLGHGMTEHGTKILVEGERKATIAPRGKENVESEVVTKQYVEAHSNVAARGRVGAMGAATKVPASGEKLVGYAVRALKDGKVLAEYYSDLSYKEIIDKPGAAAPAPAAGAAPGAKPPVKK